MDGWDKLKLTDQMRERECKTNHSQSASQRDSIIKVALMHECYSAQACTHSTHTHILTYAQMHAVTSERVILNSCVCINFWWIQDLDARTSHHTPTFTHHNCIRTHMQFMSRPFSAYACVIVNAYCSLLVEWIWTFDPIQQPWING